MFSCKAMLTYFLVFGLVGSLSVCTVSGQSPDGSTNQTINIFKGSKITIENDMTLDRDNCSNFEVELHIFNKTMQMLNSRLVSCPSSKDWATDCINGVITVGTQKYFSLENASVSLLCCINDISSSHHHFHLHAELEVATDKTATPQPFDHVEFITICTRNDSQKNRHFASYNIVYSPRGNKMTKNSLTTKPGTSKQPPTSLGGMSGSAFTLFSSTSMSSSKSNPENTPVALIAIVSSVILALLLFTGVVVYKCNYRRIENDKQELTTISHT